MECGTERFPAFAQVDNDRCRVLAAGEVVVPYDKGNLFGGRIILERHANLMVGDNIGQRERVVGFNLHRFAIDCYGIHKFAVVRNDGEGDAGAGSDSLHIAGYVRRDFAARIHRDDDGVSRIRFSGRNEFNAVLECFVAVKTRVRRAESGYHFIAVGADFRRVVDIYLKT